MSAWTKVVIVCDDCDAEGEVDMRATTPGFDVSLARERLNEVGWTYGAFGHDYCPDCTRRRAHRKLKLRGLPRRLRRTR